METFLSLAPFLLPLSDLLICWSHGTRVPDPQSTQQNFALFTTSLEGYERSLTSLLVIPTTHQHVYRPTARFCDMDTTRYHLCCRHCPDILLWMTSAVFAMSRMSNTYYCSPPLPWTVEVHSPKKERLTPKGPDKKQQKLDTEQTE